jgi:hypothetical protein
MAAPALSFDDDAETLRDQIAGLVSGLLGLVGIDADPVSSPEHVLLSVIVETAWRAGRDLDLAALIGQLLTPPVRRLGVFEIDDFFAPDQRRALALKLNTLVASPAFAAWLEGPPLDPASMLTAPDGRARAAVVTLAHLSDAERQFVVTLLLGRLVTWMRSLPGTSQLRTLVYMDEVAGYVPPTAMPPAKRPILTILKQARAFGVGMVLATQNPVDLDYKAISNAGTWMVGRLQTEQDRARLLDGMSSASGAVDVGDIGDRIAALRKRQFVLHRAGATGPAVFETRWAMSYLRGPLTREQIAALKPEGVATSAGPAAAAPTTQPATPPVGTEAEIGADASVVPPPVADGVRVAYLDAAAPWAAEIGAVPAGTRLEAALAARVHLRFDDAKAGIDHAEEWEAVWFPLVEPFDPAAGHHVDYDERDLRDQAPPGATYVAPDAAVSKAAFFRDAAASLKSELQRNVSQTVWRNAGLKLYSRVGETEEAFRQRCQVVAEQRADEDAAKLADRLEDRIARAQQALVTAQQRLDAAAEDAQARKRDELVGGAGALLGVLLGGRSRGIAGRAARTLGGASSRRGTSQRASARVDALELAVTQKEEALQAAQEQLTDEVAEISDRWAAIADDVEEIRVGLESSDVQVDDVALVWVPTA